MPAGVRTSHTMKRSASSAAGVPKLWTWREQFPAPRSSTGRLCRGDQAGGILDLGGRRRNGNPPAVGRRDRDRLVRSGVQHVGGAAEDAAPPGKGIVQPVNGRREGSAQGDDDPFLLRRGKLDGGTRGQRGHLQPRVFPAFHGYFRVGRSQRNVQQPSAALPKGYTQSAISSCPFRCVVVGAAQPGPAQGEADAPPTLALTPEALALNCPSAEPVSFRSCRSLRGRRGVLSPRSAPCHRRRCVPW